METRAVIRTAWWPIKLEGRWRWLVPYILIESIDLDDPDLTQGNRWFPIERRPLP